MTTTPTTWLGDTDASPSTDTGNLGGPRTIGLSDGRILVAWVDPDNNHDSANGNDIVGRIFNADGSAATGVIRLNTVWHGGTEGRFDIAPNGDGGWFVAFWDQNSSTTFIRVEEYDASGQRIANITIASGSSANDNQVDNPAIDYDPDNDKAVVTFQREDGGGADTQGVVFYDNGAYQVGTEYAAGRSSEIQISHNDVAVLSNGNIVTVAEDHASFTFNDRIGFKITNSSGGTVTSTLTETKTGFGTLSNSNPRVAALENGGFVVTYIYEDNNTFGVRAAVYSNSGNVVKAPFFLDSDANDGNGTRFGFADVIALDDGGFYAVWVEAANSPSLYGRRFDSSGNSNGSLQIFSTIDPGAGLTSKFETFDLGLTADGRIIISWDTSAFSSNSSIDFRIIDPRDAGITINGTSGDDNLTTPTGGGTVNAGAGEDMVFGNDGNDVFIDNDFPSGDHYDGGAGDDTLNYSGLTFVNGAVTIDMGAGTATSSFTGLTDTFSSIEHIKGSQGGETIIAASLTKTVEAEGGNDTVRPGDFAADGDYFDGGAGNDTFDLSGFNISINITVNLSAGEWNVFLGTENLVGFENINGGENGSGTTETLIGNNLVNVINGNGGRDIIRGLGGNDTLNGGAGNDEIDGGTGMDNMSGGSGDDTFLLTLSEMSNGETIDGGADTDTIFMELGGTWDFANVNLNSIDIFELNTTQSSSYLLKFLSSHIGTGISSTAHFDAGTRDMDLEFTMTGSSLDLSGLTFNGTWSSSNSIEVKGDGTSETITGSTENDIIRGDGGNDIIDGGAGGDDRLLGGAGTNTLSYESALSGVTVDLSNQNNWQNTGGGGTDLFTDFSHLIGSDFADNLTGDANLNEISGGGGGDIINSGEGKDVVRGEGGSDTITLNTTAAAEFDGGSGNDTLVSSALSADYLVDLDDGFVYFDGNEFQTAKNFERYQGSGSESVISDGADNNITITGNGNNQVFAGGGTDEVTLSGGNNLIEGGAGKDKLIAGSGNDTFRYNSGDIEEGELVDGGGGTDTLDLRGSGTFLISSLDLASIEVLDFSNGSASRTAVINPGQLGNGLAMPLQIIGNVMSGAQIQVHFDLASNQSVDLDDLTFSNWDANDQVVVNGGSGANTIAGSSVTDVIDGGAGNDNITGGLGDDDLSGGANNDTLDGGSGNDAIDGGSGNDRIIYDAADTAANVTGGTNIDTLVIIGGSAPLSYDLVAGSFELAEHQETDSSGQAWATRRTIYDDAWRKLTEETQNDDGTSQLVTWDVAGSQPWAQQTQQYNASDQLTFLQWLMSDNSRQEFSYDPSNVQPWQQIRRDYDAGGNLTFQQTTADDNSRQEFSYDPSDAQPWQQIRSDYDAGGDLTFQQTIADDSSRQEFSYDPSDAQVWQSVRRDYDTGGDLFFQQIVDDDGSKLWLNYDPANAETWSEFRREFDAAGNLTFQQIVDDDGSRVWINYDPDDAQTWSEFRREFDTAGNQTFQQIVDDDGSRVWINYDPDDAQTWSEFRREFDAAGNQTFQQIVGDDGSKVWINYDPDDAQTWSELRREFDTLDRVTFQQTVNDDGTRVWVNYDVDDSHSWDQYVREFDASGNLVNDYYV